MRWNSPQWLASQVSAPSPLKISVADWQRWETIILDCKFDALPILFIFHPQQAPSSVCSGTMNAQAQQPQQTAVPIHQQILSMTTSPYGDNPIFKDLKPLSSSNEDALKPTNPAAQKAILEASANNYKISPKVGGNGMKLKPVGSTISKVRFRLIQTLETGRLTVQLFWFTEIIVWRPRGIR